MLKKDVLNESLKVRLVTAMIEADVQHHYRTEFEKIIGVPSDSTANTDGYFEGNGFCFFQENKFDGFDKSRNRAIAIAQSIVYVKNEFFDRSKPLPNPIFFGDRCRCFIINRDFYEKYLTKDYVNWKTAPSEVEKKNKELVNKIEVDEDNFPFIYQIDDFFDLKKIVSQIQNITKNSKYSECYPIKLDNVGDAYEYLKRWVIRENNIGEEEEIYFFFYIIGPFYNQSIYLNKEESTIRWEKSIDKVREVKIDIQGLKSFFSRYIPCKEKSDWDKMVGNKDVILEIVNRIRKMNEGTFYTPSILFIEAHKLISEVLGPNWKEDYIVWDCTCGPAILTRGYKFKELYLSSLYQEDIDIIIKAGYNPEAIERFQFDFLDGDFNKLPETLKNAIKSGRPIIFFNNPPFVAQGGGHLAKKDVTLTRTKARMNGKGLGKSSNDLIGQFIFNWVDISKNSKVVIATFSSLSFLTKYSFRDLRKFLYENNFIFKKGILFDSSNFLGTKSNWGVLFSIFKKDLLNKDLDIFCIDEIKNRQSQPKFLIELKEIRENEEGQEVKSLETKIFYPCDENIFLKLRRNGKRTKIVPAVSSALVVNNTRRSNEDYLGYLGYNTLTKSWSIFSSIASVDPGIIITPDNFLLTSCVFVAGMTNVVNWYTLETVFLPQDIRDPEFIQFAKDSLIYLIFSQQSNQSSLRKIYINNGCYNILNEFFWMSIEELKQLSIQHNYKDCLIDTQLHSGDRFVYKLLQSMDLSRDAKQILETATDLLKKSFSLRNNFSHQMQIRKSNFDPCLQSWDAGWYQIKLLLKGNFKDELDNFYYELFKKFQERMKQLVYKFGMLK